MDPVIIILRNGTAWHGIFRDVFSALFSGTDRRQFKPHALVTGAILHLATHVSFVVMESSSNVVKLTHSVLSIEEVKALLEQSTKDKVIELPPHCPKAGEVYIYSFSDTIKKG